MPSKHNGHCGDISHTADVTNTNSCTTLSAAAAHQHSYGIVDTTLPLLHHHLVSNLQLGIDVLSHD
jgi:hypothetical protein